METSTLQKATLRTVGIIGTVIFTVFFLFTFAIPNWVEDFGADFIEQEAAKKLDLAIDGLSPPAGDSAVSRLAEKIYEKNQVRVEQLRSKLKDQVHEQMADAIAQIRDLDCECRQKWAELYKGGMQFELNILQTANDKVVDFIHSSYMDVLDELKRDVRIFTGTNAAVFLLLLIVSFAKPQVMTHLFFPGLLLVIATVVCSYFYVFEQNWLLTIIYSDYLGFTYLAYLGVVFLALCDIIFNRARVTTEIVNFILNAIGSLPSLVPC